METVPLSFTSILIRLGEDENIFVIVLRKFEWIYTVSGTSFMPFKVMRSPFGAIKEALVEVYVTDF